MSATDLQKIESYLNRRRKGYLALSQAVLDACRQAEKASRGLVYRSYSRAEKQAGEEMKDAAKILEKIQPPVTDRKLEKLHDIVGVTMVIYYPDTAAALFARVKSILEAQSIRPDWGPQTYPTAERPGYFATHSSFRASQGEHTNLLCELQIKTVLHDAWSAKMHDLTYKPAGPMNHRLGGLMAAVSSQIEGIEQQSLLIRDIIQGRHRLESRAFESYCNGLFTMLGEGQIAALGGNDPEVDSVVARIDALRAAWPDGDVSGVQAVIDEIDDRAQSAPFVKVGWLLMARLVSGLRFGDRSRELATQVDRFLQYAEGNPDDADITQSLLENLPSVFYVAGDLKRAVDYTEHLAGGLLSHLDEAGQAELTFNRASFLLEIEHLRPSRGPTVRDALEAEVANALGHPALDDKGPMASAIMDSRGLFKIVFGKTPGEVREGIELCIRSADIAEGVDKPVAESCREWRLEAGWRQYFDLSDQTRRD